MKVCTQCGFEKVLGDFSKDKSKRDGLRPYCKKCGVAYTMQWEATNRERRNAYRRANPAPSNQGDPRYANHLAAAYGLSLDDYDKMLAAQEYRCAICADGGSRRLAVDHCHETAKVRGLLCDKCNMGLGLFKDDPDRMMRAVGYLDA
jgi:hypothetical protein